MSDLSAFIRDENQPFNLYMKGAKINHIPITNNEGNLKLGDQDFSTVECLELEVGTQITAPIAIINTVLVDQLEKNTGSAITTYADLDFQNLYDLKNVKSLTTQVAGTSGQVLALNNDLDLEWVSNGPADASTWANYPAVANVDCGGFAVDNASTVNAGTLYSSGDINTDGNISGLNTRLQLFSTSEAGYYMIADPVGNNLVSNTNAQLTGWGLLEAVSIRNGNNSFSVSSTGECRADTFKNLLNNFNVDADGDVVCNDVTATGMNESATFKNTNNSFNVDGTGNVVCNDVVSASVLDGATLKNTNNSFNVDASGNLTCNDLTSNNIFPVVPIQYNYWVSKNGNDASDGSQTQPFLTIQNAINVCESFGDGNARVVNFAFGIYTENLLISAPRITILGQAPTKYGSVASQIDGTITINCVGGGGDMFNQNVSFFNCLITGTVSDVSTQTHTLTLGNLYIYNNTAFLQNTNVAVDCRTYITNCQFVGTSSVATGALVELRNGATYMTLSDLTSKGDAQNVFLISTNAKLWGCSLNTFTNDSTSATCPAIVSITTTQYTSPKVFGFCIFSYSSAVVKSANSPNFSTGILISGVNSVVFVSGCTFSLLGTSNGQFAVNYVAGSAVVFFSNNNSSGSNAGHYANAIQGTLNVNKFALDVVQ